MKFKPEKNQVTWGIVVLVTAILIICAIFLFVHIDGVVSFINNVIDGLDGIWYGILIAYIFTPVLNFIEKKILSPLIGLTGLNISYKSDSKSWKKMRQISVFMTLVIIIMIIFLFFYFVGPNVVYSVQSIISNYYRYADNVRKFVNNHTTSSNTEGAWNLFQTYWDRIIDYLKDNVEPATTTVMSAVSRSVVSLIRNIFNFIVGIIVSIYLMYSKEKLAAQFKKIIYALFNEKTANEVVSECRLIHQTFIGFICGKILDSIIIGILCYIGTRIIGTPYPILVSVIIGITNIIPFFGPYIGAVIGSILVFMIDPIQFVYFLIFVLLLQQFDGNILGPKILGDSTGLSSFWVIFSITFFGGVFGVAGWVIGVPTFAVLYEFIRRKVHEKLNEKGYPTDIEVYAHAAYSEGGVFLEHGPEHTKYRAVPPKSPWIRLLNIKIRERKKELKRGKDPENQSMNTDLSQDEIRASEDKSH